MTAMSTFQRLTKLWNQMAVGTNKIFRKYPEQLMQYYKLWRKNKTRKEAINETETKLVLAALQHAPKGLESEILRQKKPLTSCPKKVANCPIQNVKIDVD